MELLGLFEWLGGLFVIPVKGFAAWLEKRELKANMEARLGRPVEDRELVSIAAWMRTPRPARTESPGRR